MEQAIFNAEKGGYKCDCEPHDRIDTKHLLDPEFWRCLGKTEGWSKNIGENKGKQLVKLNSHVYCADDWQSYWFLFIDHLASGGNADDFFKQLLTQD